MDWIKVKVSHVLYEYTDLSDCEFNVWIRAMVLTAILEKIPSQAVLRKHFNGRTLNSLEKKLNQHRTTLELIMNKVLEDVEYTKHLKVKNRSKIAKWRELHREQPNSNQLPLPVTLPVTLPDKIREDKIREDKSNNTDVFIYLKHKEFKATFESYLKTRKKKATAYAKELLLKDLHKYDTNTAIAMLEQTIKHGWIGIFPLKDKENPQRRMPG